MHAVTDIPIGVLTADACIIEEQPDHIVLAIRVPRAVIGQNLPLLSALSERTGSPSPRAAQGRALPIPAALPAPRRRPLIRAALAACGGLVIAAYALPLNSAAPPPVTIDALSVDTPVLSPDGTLILTMTGQRVRACKGEIDRAILRAEDGATVWRTRVVGMGQAVTEEPITRKLLIKLPAGLTPGRYVYRYTVYSDCGDGQLHSVASPDMAFAIRA